MNYNQYIDHTLLRPNATNEEMDTLINEAIENKFKSVCVNPFWVKYCKEKLKGSEVLVCTVIGFPLGANTLDTKVFETHKAIEQGADEIDMVINISKLIEGDYDYILNEIKSIKRACGQKVLKVIIETCLLNDYQKRAACIAVVNAKADYIKTSTGFSTGGATFEDIILFKEEVCDNCKIKAAGGIKTFEDLCKMIELGADRIGTSSAIKLLNNNKTN